MYQVIFLRQYVDLEIFDKPKELFEFYYAKPCFIAGDSTPRKQAIHKAPQNFYYIEVEE